VIDAADRVGHYASYLEKLFQRFFLHNCRIAHKRIEKELKRQQDSKCVAQLMRHKLSVLSKLMQRIVLRIRVQINIVWTNELEKEDRRCDDVLSNVHLETEF
jgi:16S rRNA G527 N7-methylase RsmG